MLDSVAIQKIIPHRFPFLLIDRVVEMSADKIVALKNVSINEPFFTGHFPGHPIMPGVLIVEAMAQAGAVLALKDRPVGDGTSPGPVYFMSIDKVKFRKPVVPGDQLRIEVEPLRRGDKIWKLKGQAFVDGQLVTEAEFLASIQK